VVKLSIGVIGQRDSHSAPLICQTVTAASLPGHAMLVIETSTVERISRHDFGMKRLGLPGGTQVRSATARLERKEIGLVEKLDPTQFNKLEPLLRVLHTAEAANYHPVLPLPSRWHPRFRLPCRHSHHCRLAA
jgi:hypothetical protein